MSVLQQALEELDKVARTMLLGGMFMFLTALGVLLQTTSSIASTALSTGIILSMVAGTLLLVVGALRQ